MTQEGRKTPEMDQEIPWIRLKNPKILKIHVGRVEFMASMRIRRVEAIW